MYKTLGDVYSAFVENEIATSRRGTELSKPTEVEVLRMQVAEAKEILQSFVNECNRKNLEFFVPEHEQAIDWLESLKGE